MAIAQEVQIGETVVVRGLGLGKVKSAGEKAWIIRLKGDDDVAEIRSEKLDALVRRTMSITEANEVLQILSRKEGEPDGRSWGEQYIELQRALKTGSPMEQARLLQQLYRARNPNSAQQRVLDSYEEALLPELAHVLKKKTGVVRSQLHRGQLAFGYMAPERDDDAPISPLIAPNGWESICAFRVFSGRMAIGEHPVSENDDKSYGDFRANIVRRCLNGEWFALSREFEDDVRSGYEFVVGTRDAVGHIDVLLKNTKLLGAVAVEGGSVHFLDEEVRDDRRYQRELEMGEEPLGRGFAAHLGGDGATEIRGVAEGKDEFQLFYVKS